jgi:hypothetical protein
MNCGISWLSFSYIKPLELVTPTDGQKCRASSNFTKFVLREIFGGAGFVHTRVENAKSFGQPHNIILHKVQCQVAWLVLQRLKGCVCEKRLPNANQNSGGPSACLCVVYTAFRIAQVRLRRSLSLQIDRADFVRRGPTLDLAAGLHAQTRQTTVSARFVACSESFQAFFRWALT